MERTQEFPQEGRPKLSWAQFLLVSGKIRANLKNENQLLYSGPGVRFPESIFENLIAINYLHMYCNCNYSAFSATFWQNFLYIFWPLVLYNNIVGPL